MEKLRFRRVILKAGKRRKTSKRRLVYNVKENKLEITVKRNEDVLKVRKASYMLSEKDVLAKKCTSLLL